MTNNHGMSKIQWLNYNGYDHREQYLYYTGLKKKFLDNKLETKLEFRYTNEFTWGNHTCAMPIQDWPDTLPDYTQAGNAYWWGTNKPIDDDDSPATPYTPTKENIEKMRGWWSNKRSPGSKRYYAELQLNYKTSFLNLEHDIVGGLVYDRKKGITNPWSLAWPSGSWYGIDFDMHPGVPDYDQRPLLSQTKKAIYIQEQTAFLENKLLLTLGLRLDNHKNDDANPDNSYGNIFNPRAGLIYKYTDNDIFKILYGSAFREPSAFEVAPNLKPERMKTYEVGYTKKNEKLKIENTLNLYLNKATDLMMNQYIVNPDGTTSYGYRNGGEAEVFGFENVLKFEPRKDLRIQLNYTYQDPEISMKGFSIVGGNTIAIIKTFPIDNIPKHQASLLLSWNFFKNYNLSWIARWVDDIRTYRDHIQELDPTSTADNSNPIPYVESYIVHDVSILAKRIFGNNPKTDHLIDLSFTIHNVFDKFYENPINRTTSKGDMENPNVAGQPGRTFYLKISGKF